MPPPTDWQEGEIWLWKGRRNHISEDILSRQVTNFSGHTILVTMDGQLVSYLPNNVPGTMFLRGEECVREKNIDKLKTLIIFGGKLFTDDIDSVQNAVKAGIKVMKYPIIYSPKRLQELLASPDLLQSCKYAWNVDVDKRHLNCNTFFQAWDITKDLPWAHKMSGLYDEVSKVSRGSPLSQKDLELAYLVVKEKQRKEEISYLYFCWKAVVLVIGACGGWMLWYSRTTAVQAVGATRAVAICSDL